VQRSAKEIFAEPLDFPPLFAGCHFYLQGSFANPSITTLSDMISSAGGMILLRRPTCFDGQICVPFHAQKLEFLKNCCYFIVEDDDVEENFAGRGTAVQLANNGDGSEPDTDAARSRGTAKSYGPRVNQRSPRVAYCNKNWLLDCFDRFEIIDAQRYHEDGTGDTDMVESLRARQSIRTSRSRDCGTDYLMAL